jgi:ArsR family transcriptional regulator
MMRSLQSISKALSDNTRIRILKLVSNEELCVSELIQILKMTQPCISRHVNLLKQAGLVVDRRDGQHVYYSINSNSFNPYVKDVLKPFYHWLNKDKVVNKDLKKLSKIKKLNDTDKILSNQKS